MSTRSIRILLIKDEETAAVTAAENNHHHHLGNHSLLYAIDRVMTRGCRYIHAKKIFARTI
jgi:hypothetical protein